MESKFIKAGDELRVKNKAQGLGYGTRHNDHYEYRSQTMAPRFTPANPPEPISRDIEAVRTYKRNVAHSLGYGSRHPTYAAYLVENPTYQPLQPHETPQTLPLGAEEEYRI